MTYMINHYHFHFCYLAHTRQKGLTFSCLYMKITEIHARLLLTSAEYELALNELYLTSEQFNADLKGSTVAHQFQWSRFLLCQNHFQFQPAANHPKYSRYGKAKVGCGNTSQGLSLVKNLQKHHWDGNIPLNQSSFGEFSRTGERKEWVGGLKKEPRKKLWWELTSISFIDMRYIGWYAFCDVCNSYYKQKRYSFLICSLGFPLKSWHL